ncbi:MAG TPA: CRISPR-associated helicase/endonuclease Cas3 [Spirochaetia bacterium]|nr:MAG: hypothetical protein A2Y41_02560 [Spirochaetes bacterium GWB1_36_13]HCL57586.1 CRISPR-associated helicase/endonuclease Cas3 [Spirochaetia bacterium]
MKMLDQVWAKTNPQESLVSHTENALAVFQKLKENLQNHHSFNDEFWRDLFIAVLFHDAGKIMDNFQKMLETGNSKNNIRHELISGMLLFVLDVAYYQKTPLSLAAVFSHHKKLTDDLFSDNTHIKISLKDNLVKEFLGYAQEKIHNLLNFDRFNQKKISEVSENFHKKETGKLVSDFKNHFLKNTSSKIEQKDRVQYILHKAILNLSDWLASGHELPNFKWDFSQEYLKEKIVEKLLNTKKIKQENDFQFREFQLKSVQKSNVLAVAPTGSGKTEAALLWASQKEEISKIIYLLPTRVTSNAIFERLKGYFGEFGVSLVHSSAFFLQKELHEGDYDSKLYLKDKTFMKNITVATVDQILTMGFNLGYWEVKTFNMLEARVIIDEIHLYDPYTLGLIISTIRYLQENFKTRFFIMSATMPRKLKEILLKNLTPDTQVIEDKELLNQARNQFEIRENSIDELDDEIKDYLKQKKKVLIVVNTVDEAIRLFEKYQKYSPICYHSKFIQIDKKMKEEKIFKKEQNPDESALLIATQVVEVSLDIDYDILFTENSPIDAIIQRAGRINRARRKENTRVIIFPHREIVKKYVYPVEKILENTFTLFKENHQRRLTEQELLSMVDEVYKNIEIEPQESYQKGLNVYQEIQKTNHYIKDLVANEEQEKVYTREGMDSKEIIPFCFLEILQNASPQEKMKHEVSVRKWQYYSRKKEKDQDGFVFLDVEYDTDTGLNFKKQNTDFML